MGGCLVAATRCSAVHPTCPASSLRPRNICTTSKPHIAPRSRSSTSRCPGTSRDSPLKSALGLMLKDWVGGDLRTGPRICDSVFMLLFSLWSVESTPFSLFLLHGPSSVLQYLTSWHTCFK